MKTVLTPGDRRGAAGPQRGIFLRFALRSLKGNRTHTTVSIVGIALSCALITAIFTSVATLYTGLLNAEISTDGTWQLHFANIAAGPARELESDGRIEGFYELDTYGAALMPKSFEGYWGRYLTVQAWPDEDSVAGLAPLPRIAEGRAPEAPGEIVLGQELKGATVENGQWLYDSLAATGRDDDVPRASWEGGIQVGSEVGLALGRRMYRDERSGAIHSLASSASLNTRPGDEGDSIVEWLGDAGPQTSYTVVGFYERGADYTPDIWNNNAGYLGFIAPGQLEPRSRDALVSTDLDSRAAINELAGDYTDFSQPDAMSGPGWETGDTIAYTHDNLLRYQGMYDERSIWGTLYSLAAILSCVVGVASVSLIYNSFAIAVAERTRQFGLLASLGASRRQLRRTVYIEACLLAAVGIPLGLAIGLLGTHLVFQVAGEGVGMLVSQAAFESRGITSITVSPIILLVSAVLAFATVLASALVPAVRASRVSAIDAIRARRDVRLSKRERRAARRRRAASRGIDGLRMRLFGVSGFIAHRNLTRASSKGRVAVASLAISVALIITSGSIAHYLGYLVQVADRGASDIEVTATRTVMPKETTSDALAAIDAAYRGLASVQGAHAEGYQIGISLYGKVEPGVIDADGIGADDDYYYVPEHGVAPDGSVYTPLQLVFVDQASWVALLDANRIAHEGFLDPRSPRAVALNGTRSADEERYAIRDLFTGTGGATLFTHIEAPEDRYFVSCGITEDGEPLAVFEDPEFAGTSQPQGQDGDRKVTELPLEDALLDTFELPVGALAGKASGALAGYGSSWPTLVLPASALPTLAQDSEALRLDSLNGTMSTPFAFHTAPGSSGHELIAYLAFGADEPRAVEAGMRRVIDADITGEEWYRTWITNNAEDVRSSRIMYETVQLFINCFIGITGSIAVANVFNTLANSIILRRREFAMLRSIGMGNRAFWRMIALECLSYAWRGLALGSGLGAVVTWMIYQAMSISFVGLPFSLPMGWVLAAVCVVAIVLASSTAYALHKARAGSTIAALREDFS